MKLITGTKEIQGMALQTVSGLESVSHHTYTLALRVQVYPPDLVCMHGHCVRFSM